MGIRVRQVLVATKTKLKELKKAVQSTSLFVKNAEKIKFDVIDTYMIKELQDESD